MKIEYFPIVWDEVFVVVDKLSKYLRCMDSLGNGSVWHFDPMGEPKHRIRSCRGLNTTNLAFGGPDNKSLFITESMSGTILRVELADAGKVMYSHMD